MSISIVVWILISWLIPIRALCCSSWVRCSCCASMLLMCSARLLIWYISSSRSKRSFIGWFLGGNGVAVYIRRDPGWVAVGVSGGCV